MWQKLLFASAAALTLTAGTASAASVAVVNSGGSQNNTGVSFTANLSYDEVLQQLTVSLENTSGFQSVITGFAFNIDNDNASASYTPADDAGTAGVDESAFAFDGTSFTGPFGDFDAGALLQDLSNQQVKGIDEGETGRFVFDISGSAAGSLVAADFTTQSNDGAGDNDAAWVVRYQSVGPNAEDSDRAFDGDGPGPTPVIPLPPAVWTALITIGGFSAIKLRRRFA